MKKPALHHRLLQQETLNFLLTNRIPRITLTRLMGWYSRLRHPWLAAVSIWIWRQFSPDLNLAESPPRRYQSLQECFTRELLPGLRPFAPDAQTLCSPCDAIVGECGSVDAGRLWQAKGLSYTLTELLGSPLTAAPFLQGSYITLRLTAGMYHRFHAPHDCHVTQVDYISGDVWNVNPIALRQVEGLFCRNERAVIHAQLGHTGVPFLLVPVAAILVASIRLHFANVRLHLRYRGCNPIATDARLTKGQEMGWFEHGSTILLFVPPGFTLLPGIQTGQRIRCGQGLMRLPAD
jgi:phosphatidylserine decarboxylase